MRLLRISISPIEHSLSVHGGPDALTTDESSVPAAASPGPDSASSSPSLTLELVELLGNIPPYAILSHTWGDEEVTFRDMEDMEKARKKQGFGKVMGAFQLAWSQGYEYIWIDSCCINKDSSAELSEALNSMFQYYENSEVCYVYLSDVPNALDSGDLMAGNSAFRRCKWFTRGWTLQELLAPSELVFYDQDWKEIGTKFSLHEAITIITGIPTEVLFGEHLNAFSIAKRMSWAALRQTTRPEDQAYSLMGIFGVNMPPIYGEGLANAFMRLQLEIIRSSNDRSIFAWTASSDDHDWDNRGLFARSPFEFRYSGDVGMGVHKDGDSSFAMTNNGLRITLPLGNLPGMDNLMASLDCWHVRSQQYLGVCLRPTRGVLGDFFYSRCRANELMLLGESPKDKLGSQQVHVKEGPPVKDTHTRLRIRSKHSQNWSFIRGIHSDANGHGYRSFATLFSLAARRGIILKSEDQLTLWYTGTYSFAVVIRADLNDTLSTEIVTGVYFSDFLDTKGSIPPSYLSGSKCLGFGRIVRSLPNGESVTLAVLKTSDKSLWNIYLKVSQTPRLTLPKRLLKRPNSGFLVQLGSTTPFSFDSVFPPDTFCQKHGPDIYVSVDDKTPHRGLIFISQSTSRDLNILNVSNILVVLLGIQDAKAWTIVGGDSTSEPRLSAERIYEELIDDDKKLFWDDGRITNTSEKLYFAGEDSEEYCLAVLRMSQNTTLQPGTHCVKIEFQSTRIPRYPYS